MWLSALGPAALRLRLPHPPLISRERGLFRLVHHQDPGAGHVHYVRTVRDTTATTIHVTNGLNLLVNAAIHAHYERTVRDRPTLLIPESRTPLRPGDMALTWP